MQFLSFHNKSRAQSVLDTICADMSRRLISGSSGLCPVSMTSAMLKSCHAQSCGKCVPCRIGLAKMSELIDRILDGEGDMECLRLLERTAKAISESADCAIGFEAADMFLRALEGFRDDFVSHIKTGRCSASVRNIPCVANCPASVDIPGYISLVKAGRYEDAIRLIRKDNPFPVVCGFICEHPCESRCRRSLLDAPLNIRGLKEYAAEQVGTVAPPARLPDTGKRVAIIGGGPSGLTAAYYLSLMGHSCSVFEKRKFAGGMLRYGIPAYRLPREQLERDIDCILSTGVELHLDTDMGDPAAIEQLRKDFDAVYVAIGAHTDKKLGVEGETAQGVISAVNLLRGIGDGLLPDFKGKKVVVVGGGNVAMDCTRSAKRLGAERVICAYRRRKEDMTALPEEVAGAEAEGCIIMELAAPVRIETDDADRATALWVQPQRIGAVKGGRPSPVNAALPAERIPADIIIIAIGQNIESDAFMKSGFPVERGSLKTAPNGSIAELPGVFAGGDCVSGPATVVRAIDAGKVAAYSIDRYLGFAHTLRVDIELPDPALSPLPPTGRVNMKERDADERSCDFRLMEISMTEEEVRQEASRCLRCDQYGYACFRGGRECKC